MRNSLSLPEAVACGVYKSLWTNKGYIIGYMVQFEIFKKTKNTNNNTKRTISYSVNKLN